MPIVDKVVKGGICHFVVDGIASGSCKDISFFRVICLLYEARSERLFLRLKLQGPCDACWF